MIAGIHVALSASSVLLSLHMSLSGHSILILCFVVQEKSAYPQFTFTAIDTPRNFLSIIRAHTIDQTMQDLIPGIIYSFAALFIILDPLLSVPVFAAMTKGQPPREIHKQAFVAVSVAGALMYLFLVFNTTIFAILGLTMPSFQIAGGILLFILGLQEALGIDFGHSKEHSKTAAGVVIGTPLLCGPGTITTVMLLSRDYGLLVPFIAITLSLLATWLILYFAENIQHFLGEVVTDIMGKVLGMLLAAIAVKIITSGIMALAVVL